MGSHKHAFTTWVAAIAAVCATSGCYEGALARGVEPREGEGWFEIAGDMQLLHYAIVDGYAVFEGDVILGPIDELTDVELGEREPDRGAVLPGTQWPEAKVAYRFAADLPESYRQTVRAAMSTLEASTVIRFVERSTQTDYVSIRKGINGDCSSDAIGRRGGEQKVVLGTGCNDVTTVIHELGHVIGLFHEQSRSDRDQHVNVLWQNIQDEYEVQFATYIERKRPGADAGEYDYDSIMHYPGDAFAIKPGLKTITDKQGVVIPYNEDLSAGDIRTINALYAVGPAVCGNGVVDGLEACDYGDGNDLSALYRGSDDSECGWDPQGVCDAGCGNELIREDGELGNCDLGDDCGRGRDCWMSPADGACACTSVCGDLRVDAGEACDYGEGNRDRDIIVGGDGDACGPDPQAVCAAGCAAELTRENMGLGDCDVGDDCSTGLDCWMGGNGGCACSP